MAVDFMDGFNHWGSGTTTAQSMMLSGVYASVGSAVSIGAPDWGARTDSYSMYISNTSVRKVLGTASTTVGVSLGFSVTQLPTGEQPMFTFRDADNTAIVGVFVTSTGAIRIRYGDSTSSSLVLTTPLSYIVSETWHHVEMVAVAGGAGASTFKMAIDGVTIISRADLSLGTAAFAQVQFENMGLELYGGCDAWFADFIIRTGDATLHGDMRVSTLFAAGDVADGGWTAYPRKKFGTGILGLTAANSAVSTADSADFELGSGDYTIEGWFRMYTAPVGSYKAVLFGKWDETSDRRSYQLYIGGPSLDSGHIVFRTSSDGTAATVVDVHSWPFTFELNQWYHVAVVRDSGETMLFIDGIMQDIPVADATVYADTTARFAVGAQTSGTGVVSNTSFVGFVDEFRFTSGVARYTESFSAPTEAFGRNVTDDPSYDSVKLLMGFDSSVADESASPHTLTVHGSAAMSTPDDGDAAYETIYQHAARDDTFVAAALLPATGTFALTGVPSDGETVTIDTTVYRFETTMSAAYDVQIGATAQATLDNLVAAVNANGTEGVEYYAGTLAHATVSASDLPNVQMLVTARTAGTAGNAIATTETVSNGYWGATTLAGGVDIPAFSAFTLDRLAANTTVVEAVEIMSRAYKSDSGTCKFQASFGGPAGAYTAGAERELTVNATYYSDVFDTDPDTASDITPSTIIGAKIKLNRTE